MGLELAQVFARFGVRVTVVEALPHLLPLEEPEAGEELAKVFNAEGIKVHVGAKFTSVKKGGSDIAINLEDGASLTGERLLVATGRRANLDGLDLETVGIDGSQRWIQVDAHLRAAPSVWAIGDLTGHGAFTHVAIYQAGIAAADILGTDGPGAEYIAVPRVTFTDPEVGSVGLTESQAREKGVQVRTGLAWVPATARGWIHGPGNEGFIKLVEDVDRGVLVGATSAGPRGGEVLSMLSLAVHAEVRTQRLQEMIYAYPTFYRGIEDALRALSPTAI